MRIVYSIFFILSSVQAFRLDECSSAALGMENGEISDSQLTASSSFDKQSVGPQNARIRKEQASGAWCPKPQIHGNSYEFLQVNFDRTHVITAIETQGRFGNGTGREFATEYMIDYLRPGSKWIRYRNRTGHTFMTGNSDTVTAVIRTLDPPIIASRLRIVPHSKQTRTICLRAEVYGCPQKDGLLYYSTVPEGSRLGEHDFRDNIFEESELYTEAGIKRGLGLLSDGYVASGSPFDVGHPNASWIGWNKHHTGGTVTLLFEFDQLRNFSEILFAVYGHRMDSIDVIFSQDGTNFPLSSQISSLDRLAANSTEKRYDLRIPLHRRMARKVRVTIKFPGDWLFLTEVHFASGPIFEIPEDYDVFSNQTEAVDEDPEEKVIRVDRNMFSVLGLCLIFLLMAALICAVLCLRKRNQDKDDDYYEKDAKKELIITHLGGKSTTHLFDSQFLDHIGNRCNFGTDKTTSTSVSTKSSNSAGKMSPPTWNDFHFPPPPMTPEERIYAEPCMTLPLTARKMDIRGSMTTQRKPKLEDPGLHYAAVNAYDGSEKVDRFPFAALRVGADLGEGKFTLVRECSMPRRGMVAYKSPKDLNNVHARKALIDELRTLAKCCHPNIVQLLATDEHSGLVLEFMPLGDVKHCLRNSTQPVPLSQLLSICADMCAGLLYLEANGLIHGHLTPTHVLLDEKLQAKICSPRGPSHPAQLRYSAPESIISNSFSSASDVWAFSVTSREILDRCQRIPFEGMSNAEIVENAEKILSGAPDAVVPLIPEVVPRGLREVLGRAFDSEARSRPSFAQIYAFISRFHVR